MKHKHIATVLLLLSCLLSCSRLDNIDKRLDTLETKVSQLEQRYNEDIASLQIAVKALESNKYVTSVTPLEDGTGYTIRLSDGSSMVIRNGENGEKGDKGDTGLSGKDGASPLVGVRQDTDGLLYWTLNGEWMLSSDGSKIKASATDGKDGKDGITPQLKIENKMWMLSCDGGKTWQTLSKAVGEDGQDGRTLFSGVETEEEYVTLTLVDGTKIQLPTWNAYQKLQAKVSQLNDELSSLKTIVDGIIAGDCITDVYQISKEGREGFAFVFKKYGIVEIFNGKDGEKGDQGETGESGDTPNIGVASDSGQWYWTLNGEWLLDSDGNKVRTNGKDGTDGITPKLKIENGNWHLSYDNGESWVEAGPAKGKDGKTFFTEIDTTDESKVTFKLLDGTSICVPTQKAFSELEALCDRLNSGISNLQTIVDALNERDYVTSVTTISEGESIKGYKLTFAKAGDITLFNGADGKAPVVSAAADTDGKYYWTVNGAWMLDGSGNKIATTGEDGTDGYTPQLKVTSGDWYVKATATSEWKYVAKATGKDGKDGESFFTSVTVSDTEVTMVLASDGSPLTFRRKLALSIVFDEEAMSNLTASVTREFPYTVTSASDNIKVEALTSGDLKAKVVTTGTYTGIIRVQTGPSFDEYSKISIIVTDGDQLVIRTVSFNNAPFVADNSLYGEISGEGGEMEYDFLSSVDFQVSIPEEYQSWVSLVSTRVLARHGVTLNVKPNPGYVRTAEINVSSIEDPSVNFTFYVRQGDVPYLAVQRKALKAMYSGMSGYAWTENDNWRSESSPFEDMFGVSCDSSHNITGIDLPENNLSGPLPTELGNLTKLVTLHLQNNDISGSMPASLTDIFDAHPSEWLDFRFYGNRMSGAIPDAILSHSKFPSMAGMLIEDQQTGYGFEITEIPAVNSTYSNLGSGETNLAQTYANSEYTLLFRWAEWSPEARELAETISSYRSYYRGMGLNVIGAYAGGDASDLEEYLSDSPLSGWTHIRECKGTGTYNPATDYPVLWESSAGYEVPMVELVDNEGNIIFLSDDAGRYSSFPAAEKTDSLGSLLEKLFAGRHYVSSDYSQDGKVEVLQEATEGNGINIILMGDAFSDRLIADGTYSYTMHTAMEHFFSMEPYTSFRNLFNVYSVNVVSKNDEYFDGNSTALETYFSVASTTVGGNDSKVKSYARNISGFSDFDHALLVVVMNREYYAGTCYMYSYDVSGHDWAEGMSIAYLPLGTDEHGKKSFEALICHEAGGHGFSRLGDEYSYAGYGKISESVKANNQARMEYGWYKNIDFTSDSTQVKWAAYLTDPLYADQGLGVFAGGFGYPEGVWHSTEYSMMRSNEGQYNAPSRESIYYKIHKMAYGASWVYNREDFISYDAINRQAESAQLTRSFIPDDDFVPLAPPVIVQ